MADPGVPDADLRGRSIPAVAADAADAPTAGELAGVVVVVLIVDDGSAGDAGVGVIIAEGTAADAARLGAIR